jgi:hypothetical protein
MRGDHAVGERGRMPRGCWIRTARPPVAVALGLTAWWLVMVAETGPHLVHHLFDVDGEVECPFLAAAHDAPAASETPVLVPRPLPTREAPAVRPQPAPRALSNRPPGARAPPPPPLPAA